MHIIVIFLIVLPAAGAAFVALLGRERPQLVRQVSLGVTLLGLALAIVVSIGFLNARVRVPFEPDERPTFRPELTVVYDLIDFGSPGEPPTHPELKPIQFYLGVDGLNVWLIVLTAFLMISAVLVSWTAVTERVNEYFAWLLLLGSAMTGVFLAFDVILFYVFFELTLVPLFFLIGIWGGPERRHAARKFFIYTLFGSLITLLGLLGIVAACYQYPNPLENDSRNTLTFAIPELIEIVNTHLNDAPVETGNWGTIQLLCFLAMMVGFSIKVPMFPVHTWLPLAHVEAPTAGSVLLAGVLLKLGTYGFLRLALPLAPDAAISVGVPLFGTLAVVGIIYGAFCARAQDDIKKLVAYSSVSHLGFAMLGLFALNTAGLTGSVLQMLNHGLSTGALFLLVGMLYERYHTRLASEYSGIASKLGWLSAAMVFVCLSSVGLPGLNGFVGEAFVFFGMYARSPLYAILATGGIILGAWYLFTMLRNVFFGPLREPHLDDAHTHAPIRDLSVREVLTVAPILTLCLVIGVYPQPLIDTLKPDIGVVAQILQNREDKEDSELAGGAGNPDGELARR